MRGGGRAGKSGGGFKKDSDTRIDIPNSNNSLFHSLQAGCFEKDYLTYCANRLSDFSCVHWLPKEAGIMVRSPPLKFNSSLPTKEMLFINYNLTSNYRQYECFIHRHPFKTTFVQVVQFLLPIVVILGLFLNFLIFLNMRRLGHTYLPLCIYLSYLAVFDSVELVLRGGDMIAEYVFDIRIISAVQLLRGSACQMFPLAYNIFRHVQSTMYIGLAVDTWRFVREPMRLFNVYRKEWIRNVLILSIALYITLNCQFLWTFDLTNHENQRLHGRIVHETWVCGFSSALNQYYINYIWPLVELTAVEILPFVFALFFGFRSMIYLRSHIPNMAKLSRFLINTDFVLRVNRTFSILLLFYAFFILPRVLYFSTRFICFNSQSANKNSGMNGNSAKGFSHRMKSSGAIDASGFGWWRLDRYSSIEPWMEYVEFSVKLAELLFVIIKFIILFCGLPQFRSCCGYYLTCYCCRSNPKKVDRKPIIYREERLQYV